MLADDVDTLMMILRIPLVMKWCVICIDEMTTIGDLLMMTWWYYFITGTMVMKATTLLIFVAYYSPTYYSVDDFDDRTLHSQ